MSRLGQGRPQSKKISHLGRWTRAGCRLALGLCGYLFLRRTVVDQSALHPTRPTHFSIRVSPRVPLGDMIPRLGSHRNDFGSWTQALARLAES